MKATFILGRAGSGKTTRCLREIRDELIARPSGAPLVLLAPKQATYQLERQLLALEGLGGFSRLHVLSFERMARLILDTVGVTSPPALDEVGRVMVVRSLLERHPGELKVLGVGGRLTGLAQELSRTLAELAHARIGPERLRRLAAAPETKPVLAAKLQDLALLSERLGERLESQGVVEAGSIFERAIEALGTIAVGEGERVLKSEAGGAPEPLFGGVWLDGFARLTPQEHELVRALVRVTGRLTLAFCVDGVPSPGLPWHSMWAPVGTTLTRCLRSLQAMGGVAVGIELLERELERSRYRSQPLLGWIEAGWDGGGRNGNRRSAAGEDAAVESEVKADDVAARSGGGGTTEAQSAPSSEEDGTVDDGRRTSEEGKASCLADSCLRLLACANAEGEAVAAAREILRFVRDRGGRFREVAVVLRSWDGYAEVLRRVFARYDIPCFIDRRESVTHHPVAEALRYALRLAAGGWAHADWFGLLKTGLVTMDEGAVDRLENLALQRGLRVAFWRGASVDEDLPSWACAARDAWCPDLVRFCAALEPGTGAAGPSGSELTAALRELWRAIGVERTLEQWAGCDGVGSDPGDGRMAAVHRGVAEQIEDLWRNIELALGADVMPLTEWLTVIEAGLAGMTVGVVPPALDQVVVGTVDRSRNPELRLALVLGANEGVFPAAPGQARLLTEAERDVLAERGLEFGLGRLERIALERYLAYIAVTRATERLVVMFSRQDARGVSLQPSVLVGQLRRLVPGLDVSEEPETGAWGGVEHAVELEKWAVRAGPDVEARLRVCGTTEEPRAQSSEGEGAADDGERASVDAVAPMAAADGSGVGGVRCPAQPANPCAAPGRDAALAANLWPPAPGHWPLVSGGRLAELRERGQELRASLGLERLSAEVTGALFGCELVTSVGALEDFAACPFRYFVGRTLRARERPEFDPDARDHGEFLHAILGRFHQRVAASGRRWREVTPEEGARLVREIAAQVLLEIRHGVLAQSARSRVAMDLAAESLAGLVRQLLVWASQYGFEPSAVEVEFGGEQETALRFEVGDGNRVRLRGRIDRVDVVADPAGGLPWVVVVDYKTRPRAFDAVGFEAGLELQLPIYLRVVCGGGVAGLGDARPAGMFFVGLSGGSQTAPGREWGGPAAADGAAALEAWQHRGRFDGGLLRLFDRRAATAGDQFAYRVKKDGDIDSRCRDVIDAAGLSSMMGMVEGLVVRMGRAIFAGEIGVSPWRKGTTTACERCDFRSICRFDPLERDYRSLRVDGGVEEEGE